MLISSYPVYVIRMDSGYGLMATPDSPEDKPDYAVLVFTTESLAEEFIRSAGLEGAEVRFLRNERELGQVLAIQPSGVTHIAIDTTLRDGHLETHSLTLYDMIKNHMPLARSPWDYPVFFLQQTNGQYLAIATSQSPVLAMFTSNQAAKTFRLHQERPSRYELVRIETPKQLLEFLQALPPEIQILAFNPAAASDSTQPTELKCLEIAKVIEKFLT